MARSFSRRNAAKKGQRLFNEGRVSIVEQHERFIRTAVAGIGDIYEQVHFTDKTFLCNCPSLDMECSHIIASRLAIARRYRPLSLQEMNETVFGRDEIVFD